MKTFKQFVSEEWERGSPLSLNHQHSKRYALTHSAQVAGHHVQVIVKHQDKAMQSKSLRGVRSVDFAVDGSLDKEKIPAKHGKEILHHVHKVIKHYVERRKPEEIGMAGNTDQKNRVYKSYAKKLARQTGGKAYGGSVFKDK